MRIVEMVTIAAATSIGYSVILGKDEMGDWWWTQCERFDGTKGAVWVRLPNPDAAPASPPDPMAVPDVFAEHRANEARFQGLQSTGTAISGSVPGYTK